MYFSKQVSLKSQESTCIKLPLPVKHLKERNKEEKAGLVLLPVVAASGATGRKAFSHILNEKSSPKDLKSQ